MIIFGSFTNLIRPQKITHTDKHTINTIIVLRLKFHVVHGRHALGGVGGMVGVVDVKQMSGDDGCEYPRCCVLLKLMLCTLVYTCISRDMSMQ